MFKNMKIGTRLGMGFGIVIVLIIMMGVFSIMQMSSVAKKVDLVVNDRIPKTISSNKIIDQVNVVARALRNMALRTEMNKIIEEDSRITESAKIVTEEFDKLTESIKTEEGKKVLSKAMESRQKYLTVQTTVRKMLLDNKKSEAVPLFFTELRDAQNTYMSNINALIDFQTELASNDGKEGLKTATSAETMIIILTIITLLLSVFAAVFITSTITKPIAKCIDIADKVAAGNTDISVDADSKDETGLLLNALGKMIESIRRLVNDAGMLSKAAVEGKLDTRADASKHQGDYRKVVEGVNGTLDAVIGPLNVAAEYVDRISKGDVPQKITDTYHGDFNEIKNNLNQCINAVQLLVSDTNLLSKAAVEGKLDTRADVSKHQGDFRNIVQGVNNTLDAVIGPLNVAAEYIDRISKGDIPQKITDTYQGDFNEIKNNLNAVVKMMSDLLKETDIIIKAAADGELDKRANASLFVGGWNQLVSGINDTITNIVDPLMVTADYVDKVSKGVIPPEITTVYKGQYNIIKNNLNAVVKMMSDLLSETDKLVKAAINGQLDSRANLSLFVGGWNQLVSGVNQTLEAVLGPINEAATVLDKVAARDMTARVVGEYKGDHAKIKNSLNLAVDNLDKAMQQVTEATEQVSSASGQISSGSQSLAQGANEQASSLEEVSSSLEEMASMTKQNADNANQAKGLSAESDGNAKTGTEAMGRMSNAINRIKESSDQTAKIVKTIDEIAMQTNLLALNAAVEAARAGEAGRGFAVVAEEVRNLAQRSAQAAKNTADMITESVKNADDGVKIAVEVSQSFETIATSAKKVNDLIAEIAAASQEQSSGIEQINTAVAQMDKVTQQNAANSEESASAAEQLSSQAEELKNMISQFALSHTMVSASAPRKMAMSHTLVHSSTKERSTVRSIAKKPSGKTTSIKPEDIIPLDDEALKEF
jgi:methyl-accepting chemotaxis protein